jgi:signal transduction histidine kinase/CheY-like chemotaxis protein
MFSLIYLGTRKEHDIESIRKRVMLNVFLVLGIFLLPIMGTLALIQSAYPLAFADFATATLLAATYIDFLRKKNEIATSWSCMIIIFIFFCFLFSIGGISNTAFMWLFSFPLLSLYLLGLHKGILLTTLLFSYCCGFLALDFFSDDFAVYPKAFALRFIPSYLVVCLITSFVEKNRSTTLDAMLEKQRLLARTIDQLKQKETELQESKTLLEQRVRLRTAELLQANSQLRIEIEERKRTEQERIRLESKLLRAEKMELLGRLAGGVAHDLNNVLSGIVTYPDLLLLDMSPNSKLYEPLQTIRHSGRQAAAIVQDLLTLARRGITVNKLIQLNDIIKIHLQSPEFLTLQKKYPAIRVERKLCDQLKNIVGSPIHLQKTVMNLIINSFEAIKNQGLITVETQNLHCNTPREGVKPIPSGEYATLIISDNGIGIPKENLENIFEPFYSSKEMGHSGTGLGMTIVWSTVQDHDGYLDVKSSPGKGTTISLFFPVKKEEELPSEKPIKNCLPTTEKGHGEKILLVDDATKQHKLCEQILTTLNYCVEKVTSGEKALKFLTNNPVDLVVLDMKMRPGMDGLETYRKITQVQPQQKVIIISGFSETNNIKKALELGVHSYIRKPYHLESLASAIKKALNNKEKGPGHTEICIISDQKKPPQDHYQ